MDRFTKTHRAARKDGGSIIVEFACVAFMFAVVALLAIDCSICLYGAWQNDVACRDAVRAAAQQPNADLAKKAAIAAAKEFAQSSLRMTPPRVLTDGSAFQYELYLDSAGKPQRSKGPYVKVTTASTIKIPAPIAVFGIKMAEEVKVKQTYQFPIVQLPDEQA